MLSSVSIAGRQEKVQSVLFVTDDSARGGRLIEKLDLINHASVYDLYTKALPPSGAELIVLDVDTIDSAALVRLRSVLDKARSTHTRVLFLAHGNAARASSQAGLIGATEAIPASIPIEALTETIARMWIRPGSDPPESAVKLATEARQFFVKILSPASTITSEIAQRGVDLITHAVADSGVKDWVAAVQRFDNATHQHCLLVAGLGAAFATSLGLSGGQSSRLTKAALLHDVGKTKIPISILNKPGPLTAAESAVMRTHPEAGFDMLRGSGLSAETLSVVRSHHQMLDGSGYPDGLRGDQIPDLVRLVTICDIFGALIERRPYRQPMPTTEAYSILKNMTGRLDHDLVEAFKPVTASLAT